MTVMDNEDPALPETTEGEAWYDAEIAPALAALAKRCHERGMAFVAVVEYQPGDRAGTYYMTEDAGLAMTMQHLCAMTAPNVDAYVMNLKRHCKEQGIDTGGSFALRALGACMEAERERCAALCEAHAGMRGTGAWTVLTAAADRIRDPERAKRDAAPDSGA